MCSLILNLKKQNQYLFIFKNCYMMNELQQPGQQKWRIVSFVLTLMLCTTIAMAQVKISGKVTGKDGNGVAAISVLIRNTNYGSVTDITGVYSISANIKPGSYILDFSG